MREEVKKFAEEMEKVLVKNDFKGGWSECNIKTLYRCFETETKELKELIEVKLIDQIDEYNSVQNYIEEIQDKIIDMVNYCMMIHERLNTKIFV